MGAACGGERSIFGRQFKISIRITIKINGLTGGRGFALPATSAGENDSHIARVAVQLAHLAQAMGMVFKLFDVETTERAVRRGLWGVGWFARSDNYCASFSAVWRRRWDNGGGAKTQEMADRRWKLGHGKKKQNWESRGECRLKTPH